MVRSNIFKIVFLAIPVLIIAGLVLIPDEVIDHQPDTPKTVKGEPVDTVAGTAKSQPSNQRISPSQPKGKKSILRDFFNMDPKLTAEEVEQQRFAELDLPTLLKEKGLKSGAPVFIRAFKEERELELFLQASDGTYELLRTYRIAAASGVLGPKLAEGDNQVPEGFYLSSQQSMKPDSAFHLAFNIGYPNAYDRVHGRTGSFIMVHGSNVSIGCLAMTDSKIEEIYSLCQAALDNGQPFFRVHIFPFRMTHQRMQEASNSSHFPFWKNLKTGYDIFESTRVPPVTSVKNKEYVFE